IAFATLGTVADLGALQGENRSLVKKGLKLLQKSEWKGLKYLKQYSGISDEDEMTSHCIGYRLAPRINAAGRIDSPYLALKLLLSNDDEAEQLAEKLDQLNSERQVMTAKALEKAERLLDSQLQNEVLLVIVSDEWHAGILGLLAGRLSEKYYRPAIVIEEREDELIGSARSIESFNIIQAIGEESGLLSHFGGHHQAAGFTLKKEHKDEFISNIQNYARNTINWSTLKPTLHIDCKVNFSEVDRDFYEEIKELEPYGTENDEPVFLIEGLTVKYPKKVGAEQNHLKFSACANGRYLNAIGFNLGKHFDDLLNKETIDVVCSVGINKWNGNETLQLKVLDFG
ncbi:DHH family phosphoesterase, partial [Patescibacteria group bacterium]|nr:DHH family phosphoesterase [Patescibacteria group bacterium]